MYLFHTSHESPFTNGSTLPSLKLQSRQEKTKANRATKLAMRASEPYNILILNMIKSTNYIFIMATKTSRSKFKQFKLRHNMCKDWRCGLTTKTIRRLWATNNHRNQVTRILPSNPINDVVSLSR